MPVGQAAPIAWRASGTWGNYRKGAYSPQLNKSRGWREIKPWHQVGSPGPGKANWRFQAQQPGHELSNYYRKLQWGDFADKLPTSVYYQPGPISGSDPQEHAYIVNPVAPELRGTYDAKPWAVPEVYPEGHPLSRMPPPMQNVAAMAERNRSFRTNPEWYEMAEGEVVTPFEVLEVNVRRVGQWMQSGRHWRMMVTVVVGNSAGAAGLGVGEGRNYATARDDAVKQAFGNLIAIDPEMWTVPHPEYGAFNRTEVQLLPARTMMGTPALADAFAALGLRHVSFQVKKRRHKLYKKLMTLFGILRNLRSPKVIAQQRGLSLQTVKSPMWTYFEQVRRRRGMFELSPPGRDGFFSPNRVIDNRIPDHLKEKYFAGTEDAHFGVIASSPTFRRDAGVERYGAQHQRYINLEEEPSDWGDHLDPRPPHEKWGAGRPGGQVAQTSVPAWTRGSATAAREQWLAHA